MSPLTSKITITKAQNCTFFKNLIYFMAQIDTPRCYSLDLVVFNLLRPPAVSYPVTFLRHDDEELSQSDMQLPHVCGVSAAALSQAFHQGDVRPHFVHHTRILTA